MPDPVRDIAIIAAYDRNRAIGRKGTIPWHMPSDLRHFQRITDGSVVIMGRKTWDSLPRQPLKGRINVVVSRNPRFIAKGALTARSLTHALDLTDGIARQFVIGGQGLYEEAMPLAQRLYLTEVHAAFPGCDTFFPPIPDEDDWAETMSFYGRVEGDNHGKRVVEMCRKHNLVDIAGVYADAAAFLPETRVGGAPCAN